MVGSANFPFKILPQCFLKSGVSSLSVLISSVCQLFTSFRWWMVRRFIRLLAISYWITYVCFRNIVLVSPWQEHWWEVRLRKKEELVGYIHSLNPKWQNLNIHKRITEMIAVCCRWILNLWATREAFLLNFYCTAKWISYMHISPLLDFLPI